METRMKIYENEQFGQVRSVLIDGEPWFVGKDVCAAFGDTNYRRSLGRLDAEEKRTAPVQTAGGRQNLTVINESGLYSLLLTMEPQKAKGVSQNDAAVEERIRQLKAFRRWVTHEVLPSIRKQGAYMTDGLLEQIKESPDGVYALVEMLAAEKRRKDLQRI